MSNQETSSFSADKVSRGYMMSAIFLVGLIVAAGFLHYTAASKQKTLTQVAASAQAQFAMTQRVAMLVAQYQATRDETLLSTLKEAASTAMSNHEALAPVILSAMSRGSLTDPENMRQHAYDSKIHDFTNKAFSFAAGPSGEEAQAAADMIATAARQEFPDQWGAFVNAYIASQQKDIDLFVKIELGLYALMFCVVFYELTALFAPAMQHIRQQKEHLEHMGSTDMLTGFYNRAMLFRVVSTLISGARRHKHPLTVLAIDIDDFKAINDKFGRAAGDTAIKKVAAALGEVLRTSDVMGRVGGEEFAVFLPSTDEYRASFAAEKLRASIENLPFNVKDAVVLLRVSIGVAEMQEQHKTTDDMLRAAEAALRVAKDTGRNRVVTFTGMSKAAAPAAAAGEAAKTV